MQNICKQCLDKKKMKQMIDLELEKRDKEQRNKPKETKGTKFN